MEARSRTSAARPLAGFLCLALLLALIAGEARAQGGRAQPPPKDPLTVRLEVMLRAMRIARDHHVARPGRPALVAGAIDGLLARLDSEAEIYSRDELADLARDASSATASAGVGIEARREPAFRREARRGYRVIAAQDGTPAALAGLKAGDLITHIDGRPAGDVKSLAFRERALPGPDGSAVALTIERLGAETAEEVQLARTKSAPPPAHVEEARPGILRVRIAAVAAPAAGIITTELSRRAAAPDAPLRGVVIDLRSTAGGDLAEAEAIADAFLDRGALLTTRTRAAGGGSRREAAPGDVLDGQPLVVLIDRGTAGPAELIASALKSSGRGRLVGEKSAGRGAVRRLLPLGEGGEKGALRLTTEHVLGGDGRPLEGSPLAPDLAVEQAPADVRCRSLDLSDRTAPGLCRRRALDEDGQLALALSLLAEIVAESEAARPRTAGP